FEPVGDQDDFDEAQRMLRERKIKRSYEELLDNLRSLLADTGRLSLRVVQNAPDTASPSTYRKRFGSLRRAYELIGYGRAADFGAIDLRRRTQAMRENLIARIKNMFADQMSIVRKGGRWRSRLRLRNGPNVSVLLSRPLRVWNTPIRWVVDPICN